MRENRKITTITGGTKPWWMLGAAINLFETTYGMLDDDELEQLESMMAPTHGICMKQVEKLAGQSERWI